ncbi:MAG: UDP-N-acetylglucosamine 2-epimerase [Flavobacteriales bacterium]|nr:UDP-N-acetylglucosamine 2-epimerase [Flavobacteriales bacterium]
MGLRIGHLESGLRSFGGNTMPEEHNRVLTDRISVVSSLPSKVGWIT